MKFITTIMLILILSAFSAVAQDSIANIKKVTITRVKVIKDTQTKTEVIEEVIEEKDSLSLKSIDNENMDASYVAKTETDIKRKQDSIANLKALQTQIEANKKALEAEIEASRKAELERARKEKELLEQNKEVQNMKRLKAGKRKVDN